MAILYEDRTDVGLLDLNVRTAGLVFLTPLFISVTGKRNGVLIEGYMKCFAPVFRKEEFRGF